MVGLTDRMHHYPRQLSGGQEQRVTIARAIVSDPTFLLCDEPTGDLDRKSADEIMALIDELVGKYGKTVLMVTHDPVVAARAHITLHLEKGVAGGGVQAGAGRCGRRRGMKFARLIFANLFRKKIRLMLTIGSFAVALFPVCVSRGRAETRSAAARTSPAPTAWWSSTAPRSSTRFRLHTATRSCAFPA